MTSRFEQHKRAQREAARNALNSLATALEPADIVLPSLGVDWQSAYTGIVLVELGNARPDVVERLADVVRRGTGRADH